MTRWCKLFVVMVVVGLLPMINAFGQQSAPTPSIELKLGLSVPLTGVAVTNGLDYSYLFSMAVEDLGQFKVGGKTYKWTMVTGDNLYTSAGGASSASKLLYDDKVKFAMVFGTNPVATAQPILEGGKVITHYLSSAEKPIGPSRPYSFRVYTSPVERDPAWLQWIAKNRPEKAILPVMQNNTTGKASGEGWNIAAKAFGLTQLAPVYFDTGATDFYPTVTKILGMNPRPEGIYVLSASGAGPLLKQLRELGYKGQYYGTNWDPDWLGQAGSANLEGLIFAAPAPNSPLTPPGIVNFYNRFKAKYGRDINPGATYTYAWPFMLAQAIQKAGTVDNPDQIVKILETQTFQTPLGDLVFGGEAFYGIKHQLITPVWISQCKNGVSTGLARIDPDQVAEAQNKAYK